jgi:DnaJ-class molecular chaperone
MYRCGEYDAGCEDESDDPFSALGLHPTLAGAQEVRAAFRRLAIETHPDKHGGGHHSRDGTSADFSALVDARDRALVAIAARPPPWRWAIWVASTILRKTHADAIEVALDVELADLHRARVKKVCLGVFRVGKTPFRRTRQTLFVRLVNPTREDLIDRVVFRGAGDDAPAAVLLSDASRGIRGDVVVRVRVVAHPTYAPDTVLYPCDLHVKAAVSLLGHYTGETVRLPHPNGSGDLAVEYPKIEKNDSNYDDDIGRRVRTLHGMGLPYVGGDGAVHRGDLYVFMRVVMPRIGSLAELEGLRAWPPASVAWSTI